MDNLIEETHNSELNHGLSEEEYFVASEEIYKLWEQDLFEISSKLDALWKTLDNNKIVNDYISKGGYDFFRDLHSAAISIHTLHTALEIILPC